MLGQEGEVQERSEPSRVGGGKTEASQQATLTIYNNIREHVMNR
jgi:hypothetical protein